MMESDENKRDNSAKAWSNVVESPEQVNVNAITAHSYKCIFCKRGFSTGPALGGHMNIHRRDRAQAMSDQVLQVYQKPDEGLESFGYYLPQVDHHSLYPPVSELPKRRCTSYLMESSSTIRDMRPSGDEETRSRSPYELSLFSKELHQGLGIHAETVGKRKGECGELDLELRLGPRAVRHRVA